MPVLCGRWETCSCMVSALYFRRPFNSSTKRDCSCLSRRAVILRRASCPGVEKRPVIPASQCHPCCKAPVDHPALGSTLFRLDGSPARVEVRLNKGSQDGQRPDVSPENKDPNQNRVVQSEAVASSDRNKATGCQGGRHRRRLLQKSDHGTKRVRHGHQTWYHSPTLFRVNPELVPAQTRRRTTLGTNLLVSALSGVATTPERRSENGQQIQGDLFIVLDVWLSEFALTPVGNTDQSFANRHGHPHFEGPHFGVHTEWYVYLSKSSYDNDISGVWMRRGYRRDIPLQTLARRPWCPCSNAVLLKARGAFLTAPGTIPNKPTQVGRPSDTRLVSV